MCMHCYVIWSLPSPCKAMSRLILKNRLYLYSVTVVLKFSDASCHYCHPIPSWGLSICWKFSKVGGCDLKEPKHEMVIMSIVYNGDMGQWTDCNSFLIISSNNFSSLGLGCNNVIVFKGLVQSIEHLYPTIVGSWEPFDFIYVI